MKLLPLLIIVCSIISAVPFPATKGRTAVPPQATTKQPTVKDAKKVLNPSLKDKITALLTGKPKPAKSQAANIKDTDWLVVKNEDKTIFMVDKSRRVGKGDVGSVYEAKNLADPNTPIVMKETCTNGSFRDTLVPRNPGESWEHHNKRLRTARKEAATRDQEIAKALIDKEYGYYERMGISAGKPVVVSNGYSNTIYLPMKRVEGVPLYKELQKGTGDPSYISTRKLLSNARAAIRETHRNGIFHRDAHVGNVMVTKDKGKMIDYANASEISANGTPQINSLTDHRSMVVSLRKNRGLVHPTRLKSFDKAVNSYAAQLKIREEKRMAQIMQ